MILKFQLFFNIIVTIVATIFCFWWSSGGFANSTIKAVFFLMAVFGIILSILIFSKIF